MGALNSAYSQGFINFQADELVYVISYAKSLEKLLTELQQFSDHAIGSIENQFLIRMKIIQLWQQQTYAKEVAVVTQSKKICFLPREVVRIVKFRLFMLTSVIFRLKEMNLQL